MDASDVYLASARIDHYALQLRARASLILLQLEGTRWNSDAATAAFAHVQDLLGSINASATRLQAIADATYALAFRVSLA